MKQLVFFSSVEPELLQSLAPYFSQEEFRLVSQMSTSRWRELRRRGGRVAEVLLRLKTNVVFPLQTLGKLKSRDNEILIPTTNPPLLPLFLVLSKPLHGRPVVPLMYDLFPDVLEAMNEQRHPTLLRTLFVAANRVLAKHADAQVFLGKEIRNAAEKRYGKNAHSEVIETGATVKDFVSTAGLSPLMKEIVQWADGCILVTYCGNIGTVHDVDTMGRGIVDLFLRQPDLKVRFAFAATGQKLSRLKEHLAQLRDDRVRFLPPLEHDDWTRFLQRSDISLITLSTRAGAASVPSKLFSAMASRNAILAVAPDGCDLRTTVESHDAGRVVHPGETDAFVAALLHLIENEEARTQHAQHAVDAVETHYEFSILADKWRKMADQLQIKPTWLYQPSKRVADILTGGIGLMAVSSILGVTALAILSTMGRPVLFTQLRPGKNGRPFKLYKFRTMTTPKPGEDGVSTDAARLTRLGKLLRATSIDELPTLFNVLKGDMSLVGPRPLLMQYLERYSPEQARRHEVKPGITGWAQVNGRNALSWEDKFKLDVWYVDHRSLMLDLKILAMTVLKVLKRDGINHDGAATMHEFMGSDTCNQKTGSFDDYQR